jgi:hemerythrin-like domain-containing protein
MKNAITILRNEHRSISAVLSGLKELGRMAHEATERPDFKVVRAMLRYIDEYPERLHHPKEDQHLFARLLARLPSAKPLIDALQAEHVEGARLVRELERALLFLEDQWPAGTREFRELVDQYARFHWDHMRKEEEKVLPLAELHLSQADWEAIDAAFAGNGDPIADLREQDFQVLFSRITSLAPAPIGLGDPWKKIA